MRRHAVYICTHIALARDLSTYPASADLTNSAYA